MRLILKILCILLFSVQPALSDSYLDRFCSQKVKPDQYTETDVKKLMTELKSKAVNDRAMAADTLSCLGELALPALPSIIELFNEPNGEVRLNMIAAVTHFGALAVPELEKSLNSKDKDIRRGACVALGKIGPEAKSALPKLRKLIDEPGNDVSLAADRAIKRITASDDK
jgi:HEAT repeat protein